MLRAVVVFIVSLVLLLVLLGAFGAVGPYELLLAVVVALAVAWVSMRRRRRT